MTEAVAEELRAELARQRRSAKALAEDNGLNRSTLHKTLNAQRAIDVDDVFELADLLGVSPSALFERAESSARLKPAVALMESDPHGEAEPSLDDPSADVDARRQDDHALAAKARNRDRGGEDGQG